jgi:hypothetical protein
MFIYTLLNILKNFLERLEEEELDYEESVDRLKEIQNTQKNLINGVLFGLLYLDGLIMINIENINKIQYIALSHKINLFGIFTLIMKMKIINPSLKEIASHLFCAIIGFCDFDSNNEDLYRFVINWTNEHHIITYLTNINLI